ncbi:hypothetical protein A3A56_03545 [Candidatus Roizmanbacteria bacterium RIFCSPLOWO2_01_FULL_40_32]|nr:MAG: hypothetical protein A3A56_03545 [Candidatus Roizmanbacteria bacterium RIFCSPLOWO2_01_FULL_40_32]
MTENYTPIPISSLPNTRRFPVTPLITSVLTLSLFAAIGVGVFVVNKDQGSGAKAFSTDECIGQGGYNWPGSSCPQDTTQLGTIDAGKSTGSSQLVCCRPNTVVNPKTEIPTPIPPSIVNSPPSEKSSCDISTLPIPRLEFKCQDGCIPQ